MDNWLANIVGDVDSLHVEIDNLNDPLVGFCFIRSIDVLRGLLWSVQKPPRALHRPSAASPACSPPVIKAIEPFPTS
jgi:hypothetical protein